MCREYEIRTGLVVKVIVLVRVLGPPFPVCHFGEPSGRNNLTKRKTTAKKLNNL